MKGREAGDGGMFGFLEKNDLERRKKGMRNRPNRRGDIIGTVLQGDKGEGN